MLDRKDHSRPKTPRDYLRLFLTGFAMGSADIVPGVSGGTMAFILGIYEDLLNAIKSFNPTSIRLALGLKFRELFDYIPIRFLIVLGAGIATAIVLLSGLLSRTLADPTGRVYLFAFFFGLVVASIIAVGGQLRWSVRVALSLAVGAVVAFIIVNLVPAQVPHDPLNLFLAGMVAICAMILPGISGSFILLILGQYDHVLSAVSNRDILTLVIVAAGCVVGIVVFSRVLSWLLKRYYHVTVGALVGFMIGSLWKIWPWKSCVVSDLDRHGVERCLQEVNLMPDFASQGFIIALGLVLLGFLVVSVIDHLQSGSNPIIGLVWRRQTKEALASE
jgi:putative membrane protein